MRVRDNHDAQIVCPYCQKRGSVRTEAARMKSGISGGKATGAVMTGGVSMLFYGLSRKQSGRSAKCSHCGMSWFISSV
jgi:DNA-directed RNA polymerase subunit RPC12/RpoP